MKSIIIVFALIAAASCDVSEIVKGDGWYKDETGYHYTQPETKFDAPQEPEQVIVEEVAAPEQPAFDEILVAEVPETVAVVQDEVQNEYLPPLDYLPPDQKLKEYLPPNTVEAKRKRQTPVRQVRKVYRRFVRKH